MTTETLSERVKRAANEIYERTIPDDKNWIDHFHAPDTDAATCGVCKALGLTQADWDRALAAAWDFRPEREVLNV